MQVNRRNIILIATLLVVSILLVVSSSLFSVKGIIIYGQPVNEQVLKDYINTIVKEGDSIFAIDKNYIIRCIETNENFAELKVEKIEAEFPNKVAVTVSKRNKRYYFGNGPYYILDSELKVIERLDKNETPPPSFIEIEFVTLPEIPIAHKINDDVLRGYTELFEGKGETPEVKGLIDTFRSGIESIRKESDFNYTIKTDKGIFIISHVNSKGLALSFGQILGFYNKTGALSTDEIEIGIDANGGLNTLKENGVNRPPILP